MTLPETPSAFVGTLTSQKKRLREHFCLISEPSGPLKHSESAIRVIIFEHSAVFASGRLRASQNRSRGVPGASPEAPESSPRAPKASPERPREASGALPKRLRSV